MILKRLFNRACILVASIMLFGCEDNSLPDDTQIRDYSEFFSALPEQVIYPQNNPYTIEKEKLGEFLFWDPILSGNQNVACASCHHPQFGWADGRAFSIGSDGVGLGPERFGNEITPIHAPSIVNSAFVGLTNSSDLESFISGPYFWDLRADTLSEQARGPIENPVEMLGYNYHESDIMDEVILRLSSNNEYVALFTAAFSDEPEPVTAQNISDALATFQRKVVSTNSRFDLFLRGDSTALTQAELIGLNKFIDGGCASCHSGPMLSDNLIHEDKKVIEGLAPVRTPALRNVAFTAPYMQDGSRSSLADAISIYEDRGDLEVTIGEGDFGDIERFLLTLSGPTYNHIPQRVPSGLPVGGAI